MSEFKEINKAPAESSGALPALRLSGGSEGKTPLVKRIKSFLLNLLGQANHCS